jgi:hypothetical protein
VHWLTEVAREFTIKIPNTIMIHTDSQSCIEAVKNQKFSYRTKHIDTRHHFIRDKVNEGKIKLIYIRTDENIADMMTKPLGGIKIKKHREDAGLINPGGDTS